jgi:predicted small lipoprotein YifL
LTGKEIEMTQRKLWRNFMTSIPDCMRAHTQKKADRKQDMQKFPPFKILSILVALFLMVGCASHGPVLYPNAHLKAVGEEQAKKDIEECDRLADAYVKSDAGKEAAKSTVVGGAAGAVVGGAVGAVTGSLGRGSVIGAAAGAAGGLVRGISKASQPSPLHKRFVERCLRERGYDPMGWE